MQEQRNMADLQSFLEDGQRSEQQLQHRLYALKEAHRQHLLEAEKRQREGLEKRIQQNALLSADMGGRSSADRQLEVFFNYEARCADLPSSMLSSTRTPQQVRQTERPVTASTAWTSSTAVPKHVHRTSKIAHRGPHQGPTETETIQLSKEDEEEAECRRKFCAIPVPSHVFLPLYQEIIDAREQGRKQGHDQRRNFLLSMQKPFSFMERDERKREKLIQMLSTVTQQNQKAKTVAARKAIPKATKDPAISEHLKAEELSRKIRIQTRAQETLRNSTAPIETQPGPVSTQRTKSELLAFLDVKPTFHPRTNSKVPDFDHLHKAFQREALRKAERKDVTRCQPFHLRTSTLPVRPSRISPQNTQEPTSSTRLKRSNSIGGLASLSTDTLPTYITDAARKRCMAIRMSIERNETQRQESEEWMRRHQMRSQALKKTVVIRAKVMDPHCSLKEVHHEKLKQHREADQQRMRDYKRELQDMKARVTVRPYLFEQVIQRNAKADAERTFRNKLKEAGLNEHFVEMKGEEAGVTSVYISDKDDDADDQSIESDIQTSEADEDDGEKIEEVKQKSMKTKEEKCP